MAKLPAVIGARVQHALNGVVYFGKIVDVQRDSVVVKPDWADSDKENLFVRNFITSGWELCAE